MYVSIRDVIALETGFDSLHEALTYYDLDAVEVNVKRDFSLTALQPTREEPRLFIDRDEGVEKLERQTKGAGLRISAFLLSNDFNTPSLDRELDWVVRVVEVAGGLGIPAVRVDAIMSNEKDLPLDRRQDIFAKAVHTILERTPHSKVELGIENHGGKGNDPEFLDGLMKRVGSHRLGMTLDVGNFYWSGKPLSEVYRILEHFAPVAKHTHIKNIAYPPDIRETQREIGYEYGKYVCPIPDGDLDMKRIVGILKKGGYKRDLCIEDESLGKFDVPTRQAHVKAAIATLRAAIG
jgi:sugar phosphate isomerase/epimerase